ncbi:MAG: hypothetical protein KC434_14035 [Anaerolineales bacterium]|nr:hypothetical protein [Anaerolineales bacterium]
MAEDFSTAPKNWAAELRDLVNRSFDTNEMHELAFDFNLDFDDIPGRGKSAKIVELLQMLARQQRVPEFVARCQELRPRENWEPLLQASRTEPLTLAVDYAQPGTAVPAAPSPPFWQNKAVLIGLGVLVIAAIVVAILLRGKTDFAGDKALVTKIEAMTNNPKSERQLFFDEGTPGWRLTSNSAVFLPGEDGGVELGPESIMVRDRTYAPGQAILVDFSFDEVNSTDPVVTFTLHNAPNAADATRIISLRVLTQPDSVAIENGEEMAASQFARNATLVADSSYTVIMGLDENGRFLATLFGFVGSSTAEDAIFKYDLPDWTQDSWWFSIDTGSQGSVTLISGWDFTFDTVK